MVRGPASAGPLLVLAQLFRARSRLSTTKRAGLPHSGRCGVRSSARRDILLRRTMCALLGAVCAAAALAAPAGAAVQVSQSGWFWGNPTPQGNTLRALDFLSGSGYAVGDAGTALRTDDGGATWTGLATGTSADLDRLQVVTP